MQVLVVVDVQNPYVSSEDAGYVQRVVNLIHDAKARGYFICVLEQKGPVHHTRPEVMDALRGYDLCGHAVKSIWNGSRWVKQMLHEKGIKPSGFVLSGAFSEECVLGTMQGLRYYFGGTPMAACVPTCLNRQGPFNWAPHARVLGFKCIEKLS
jgi:nicotinamidase-related amidase